MYQQRVGNASAGQLTTCRLQLPIRQVKSALRFVIFPLAVCIWCMNIFNSLRRRLDFGYSTALGTNRVFTLWIRQTPPISKQNVFLIMSDGLRWQEVFGGARTLMNAQNGGVKIPTCFARNSGGRRRSAVAPCSRSSGRDFPARPDFRQSEQRQRRRVDQRQKFFIPAITKSSPALAILGSTATARFRTNVTVFDARAARIQGKVAVFATWTRSPHLQC